MTKNSRSEQLKAFVSKCIKPASNWQSCILPTTTEDLFQIMNLAFLGLFCNQEEMEGVLKESGYLYQMNERDQKYYWLINTL